ncbi:MAG: hypothetical protein GX616_24940 [Planctomycetes bacterium]|nr:hypothetical protein [Planctomycetota bacterium]
MVLHCLGSAEVAINSKEHHLYAHDTIMQSHLAAILIGAGFNASNEAAMAWTIFMLIDFPLGWLMIPLELCIGPIVRDNISLYAARVVLPAIGFLVLGGIQYYCLGRLIALRRNRY